MNSPFKITIKQIANELGVSVSTVSKALNNSPEVNSQTKEKIQAFARQNHYRPNLNARRLQGKRTRTLGVVIPEVKHDFFSSVLSGIEFAATEQNYSIVVCLSNETLSTENKALQTLMELDVDGILISLSKETQLKGDFQQLRHCINLGKPMVLFDRITEDIVCDKVVADDVQAAYQATTHLIQTGCHRIALLTVPNYISVANLREKGYKNALIDAGLTPLPELIRVVEDLSSETEIFDLFLKEDFDAVLCTNEVLAIKALHHAQHLQIEIPQRLSIIGIADGFLTQNAFPKLTAIDQHGEKIGKRSVALLINRLENNHSDDFHTEIIKTKLIERDTTRKF